MKAKEFIKESVTFSVAKPVEYEPGKVAWSDQEFGQHEEAPCWVCDGTGKDREYTCDYCHGKGTYKEWKSNAPELNVANTNAMEIQRMLGFDPDYSGVWEPKDLPVIMKKLIRLKNTDTSRHTRDPSVSQSPASIRNIDGITGIGRGPTMYDGGRSQSQVDRYVDTLISMVRYAQEHDAGISFG